jgi:laminin alpha 1/2
MFNQKLWRPGKFITANACERCQCYGHADECFFDPQVEADRRSLNTEGTNGGGGVCIGCRHHTDGINCEYCKEGYYRPANVSQFDPRPCHRCRCAGLIGSKSGLCYNNADAAKLFREGVEPGDCVCKPGFAGPKCEQCDRGFHNYPNCEPCPCSLAGTLNGACSGRCDCKENVEGRRCDRCKRGYYALHEAHASGCLECFCYGITDQCDAAQLGVELLQHAEGWKVTDLRGRLLVDPYWSTVTNGVTVAEEDMKGLQTYFWQAPEQYIGNRLVSYGLHMKILTSWHTGRGDTAGTATKGPDIVIESGGGMLLGYGALRYKGQINATIEVKLEEKEWYHIPTTLFDIEAKSYLDERPDFIGKAVSKVDFMRAIGDIERLLIRTKYHTDQLEGT